MGLREIKAALRRLENEGNDLAVRRLILAVPFKRGKAPHERSEIIAMIAKGRGETVREVAKMVAGWKPGVLVRAESHDSHPMEGDLALLGDGAYEHTGEIVYPHPEDLRWDEAQIVDDNGELHDLDRWEDAVYGILYGADGRGGRGMYFAAPRSRSRYGY